MFVIYSLISIIFAVFLVEFTGYFWHRWVEHNGVFGQSIQKYHIQHHNTDYPVSRLRPNNKYHSARSVGWYLLTVVLVILAFLLIPRPYNLVAIASGLIYARLVLNYLHTKYHIKNHWLAKTRMYKKIQRLHDIHHWGPYNYGILFYFMDKIFGTYRETFPSKKQPNFVKDL